jgi:hypothetical protein
VRRLRIAGRVEGALKVLTFEAFPNAPDTRLAWRIPAEAPKPTLYYTRLTEREKGEIGRRALRRERKAALADEYGVTRAYVHRLAGRVRKARPHR